MENYLMTVMAVQKLMQNELSLLSGIIPSQHQHQVFQIIIQEALDAIVQDGEVNFDFQYFESAPPLLSNLSFSAVLTIKMFPTEYCLEG